MSDLEKTPLGWDKEKGGWRNKAVKSVHKNAEYLKKNMHLLDASQRPIEVGSFDCIEAVQVYVRMILEGEYSGQEQQEKLKELAKTVSVEIINEEIKKEESDFLKGTDAVACPFK